MSSIDFVKVPLQILKTVGLRMSDSLKKGTDEYLFKFSTFFYFAVLNTILSVLHVAMGTITKIKSGADLATTGRYLFPLCFFISMITKVVSLLSKRRKLNDLLVKLDNILPLTSLQRRDYRFDVFLNWSTKVSTIFAFVQISSILYISYSSIVIQCFRPRGDNETFYIQLPYGEEDSSHEQKTFYYVILLILQLFGPYICISTIYAVNFTLYGIVLQIRMHYEHLFLKLKNFRKTDGIDETEDEHLIWCILKHDQLYE